MRYFTLIKANFRSKKGTFIGVGILIFIITVCLCAVINIFENASDFEERELERIGYGDISYWVADSSDVERLKAQIEALDEVEKVEVQAELFVVYSVNGIKSSSSAFGIAYEEGERGFHIYNDDLSGINTQPAAPEEGEVYVSPSFQSLYNAGIGDNVDIHITGEADARPYRIAGYFEDPVAGSSIMGLKSILFNEKDLKDLKDTFEYVGDASLGIAMYGFHITRKDTCALSDSGFQRLLNERTDLTKYPEFFWCLYWFF